MNGWRTYVAVETLRQSDVYEGLLETNEWVSVGGELACLQPPAFQMFATRYRSNVENFI